MTDRKAKKRRLERAGYVYLAGWVPSRWAEESEQLIDAWRSEVERVLDEPPQPRGRPRKPV